MAAPTGHDLLDGQVLLVDADDEVATAQLVDRQERDAIGRVYQRGGKRPFVGLAVGVADVVGRSGRGRVWAGGFAESGEVVGVLVGIGLGRGEVGQDLLGDT